MKKLIALLLIAVMAVSLFAACAGNQTKPADPTAAPVVTDAPAAEVPETEAPAAEVPETPESAPADNFVDLNGFYTITDPEGVEYDQRIVLYDELSEEDEDDATMYDLGIRHDFVVVYGKDNQGVFSYEVVVLETEEQAAAYAERNGGTQDGTIVVLESDASYFEMMSAFLPDLQTYIDFMAGMGLTVLD